MKVIITLAIFIILTGCSSLSIRSPQEIYLDDEISAVIANQRSRLASVREYISQIPEPTPEMLEDANSYLQRIDSLAEARVERFVEVEKQPQIKSWVENYKGDSIRFATLMSSIASTEWVKDCESREQKESCHYEDHDLIPSFKKLDGEKPAETKLGQMLKNESAKNLKELRGLYLRAVAPMISKERAENERKALLRDKAKREAQIRLATAQQVISKHNLEYQVDYCVAGPIFAEYRTGLTLLETESFLDDMRGKPAKTEKDLQAGRELLDKFQKSICECLVGEAASQNVLPSSRFESMLKGERMWDIWGTPQAKSYGTIFMTLMMRCGEIVPYAMS